MVTHVSHIGNTALLRGLRKRTSGKRSIRLEVECVSQRNIPLVIFADRSNIVGWITQVRRQDVFDCCWHDRCVSQVKRRLDIGKKSRVSSHSVTTCYLLN
ncbi:hypothetical protein D3C80_1812120 [compost metagenome]